MKIIDNFLNNITMYRLTLYSLFIILIYSVILSFFDVIHYDALSILISISLISVTCFISNIIFSKIFKAATNYESWLITALILSCVLLPINIDDSYQQFLIIAGISAFSMLSKYIFVYNKKHIFNPVAIALVLAGLIANYYHLFAVSYWWIGTSYILPLIFVLGLLLVRKIHRFSEFLPFILLSFISILGFSFFVDNNFEVLEVIKFTILSGPIVFFATFMLIEPLTTPPKINTQILYGIIVGIFYGAQFHIGPIHSSPELALVIGNIFAFFVSSKQRIILTLIDKKEIAKEIFEFNFKTDGKLDFVAGQYLEWTLAQHEIDSRGNRRYFTVASSPTEENIKLCVRVTPDGSEFKKELVALKNGDSLSASSLAGDFTLLKDQNRKLVFIAGGIGITPFRSMIKFLLDTNQNRDIVLIYGARDNDSFAYGEFFDQASEKMNLRFAKNTNILTKEFLEKEILDIDDRDIYISGPGVMVQMCKDIVYEFGIKDKNIHTDYFPGF